MIPPIVCGVIFSPFEDGIWKGDVPEEKIPMFFIGHPGAIYWLDEVVPVPVVPVPVAVPGDPMAEACKIKGKSVLAAWAKDTLGLEINPEAGTRDWMLGVIAEHLNPNPEAQDPADAALEAPAPSAPAEVVPPACEPTTPQDEAAPTATPES
jgi:hypothetical protein